MTEKYSVGIAGPDINRIAADYTYVVSNHERFVLGSLHNSWSALKDYIKGSEPYLLVIYADIAPNPDALKDVLANLKSAIAIILLPANWAQFQGVFEKVDRVRKIFVLPVVPKEVIAYGLSLIETEIARNSSVSMNPSGSGGAIQMAVGTRVIAFVSAQGGVGRSTLAEAMERRRDHRPDRQSRDRSSGCRSRSPRGQLAQHFARPSISVHRRR